MFGVRVQGLGALMITKAILGVPYYGYSIMHVPQIAILIIKAPILPVPRKYPLESRPSGAS